MTSTESVRASLADFFAQHAPHAAPVAPETDLFAAGVLDSFGVLQLAMFVEENWGVALDFETLEEDDFRNLDTVTAVIERERGSGAAAGGGAA